MNNLIAKRIILYSRFKNHENSLKNRKLNTFFQPFIIANSLFLDYMKFFNNQHASLVLLIFPLNFYFRYILTKKEILKISYEEDNNRLFFLIKRSLLSDELVEVNKNSIVFNKIDCQT